MTEEGGVDKSEGNREIIVGGRVGWEEGENCGEKGWKGRGRELWGEGLEGKRERIVGRRVGREEGERKDWGGLGVNNYTIGREGINPCVDRRR